MEYPDTCSFGIFKQLQLADSRRIFGTLLGCISPNLAQGYCACSRKVSVASSGLVGVTFPWFLGLRCESADSVEESQYTVTRRKVRALFSRMRAAGQAERVVTFNSARVAISAQSAEKKRWRIAI